jgi:hypothetical protein
MTLKLLRKSGAAAYAVFRPALLTSIPVFMSRSDMSV